MIKHSIYKVFDYLRINKIYRFFLRNTSGVILAYHRVSPLSDKDYLLREMVVDPVVFEKQMLFLIKNYTVVSLENFKKILKDDRKQTNYAVITFDDAYLDTYEYAFPILKKYNFPATVFVPTDFIETGRHFWWDRLAYILENTKESSLVFSWNGAKFSLLLNTKKLIRNAFNKLSYLFKYAEDGKKEELFGFLSRKLNVNMANYNICNLSWDNIKEMSKYNMSFGAHTHTHCAVSNLSESCLIEELNKSRELLGLCLNREIINFAFPYGEKNDCSVHSINAIRSAGYKAALTMIQRPVTINDNPFLLPRIGIGGEDTEESFELKLAGLIPFFKKR